MTTFAAEEHERFSAVGLTSPFPMTLEEFFNWGCCPIHGRDAFYWTMDFVGGDELVTGEGCEACDAGVATVEELYPRVEMCDGCDHPFIAREPASQRVSDREHAHLCRQCNARWVVSVRAARARGWQATTVVGNGGTAYQTAPLHWGVVHG